MRHPPARTDPDDRRARNRLALALLRPYARLHESVHERLRVNLPGFGFLLRRLRGRFLLDVDGERLAFDERVAESYGRLVAGRWNEPETHRFLRAVIGALEHPCVFVDVGANVGEMVVDLARSPDVARVIAIEPAEPCVEVLRRTRAANSWGDKVRIIARAAAERVGRAPMLIEPGRLHASRLAAPHETAATLVETTTLDEVLAGAEAPVVVLIDVEGSEPSVLRGARESLRRLRPLVVFEYNDLSRERYRLETVREVLGPGYRIRALRRDARLDDATERAWNCVAVPLDTPFTPVCEGLTAPGRAPP